jgi:HlyD family secretion protein
VTLAGSQIKTRSQAAADAQPPEASAVTAVVEQRILVQTVSFRGRVRSRQEVPVIAAASAATSAVVVTDTPNRSGAVVTEGSVVIEVSGRPVVVLAGPVPMYRDLRPGSSGPDVAAVQAALERLGFPAGDPVGAFGGYSQDKAETHICRESGATLGR